MKKIVSYCLYGTDPMYFIGIDKNIELCKKYYPDFEVWIYVDDACTYENPDAYIIRREMTKGSTEPMFWRFEALEEGDIVLIRDADSRIGEREVAAVNEWLASDKDIHIMRDHPWHTTEILGGMFGARGQGLKGITQFIEKWPRFDTKGDDQLLLKSIYPLMSSVYEHSEFGIKYKNEVHPFPTKRENYEFVGEVYDENEERHPQHYQIIELYEHSKSQT